MNKKDILYTLIALVISSGIFFVEYKKLSEPQELYRVYLKGETIGYIKNKELLEEYIDNEQITIKEEYNVDKVYLPNDLDIVKEVTYNEEVLTEKEIYEEIKDKAPFTIKGYTITIKGVEVQEEGEEEATLLPDQKIYVLDKELFKESVKDTIQVFISEKDYENFMNKTQPEIKDVGSLIEDIYIKNQITITEGMISSEEKIFTDKDGFIYLMSFGIKSHENSDIEIRGVLAAFEISKKLKEIKAL